jgi:hypothetical protein
MQNVDRHPLNTSLRAVMPTRRKALLTHRTLEHAKISKRFHKELCARQKPILEHVGFREEFGDPDLPTYTGEQAATELLSELAGLLVTAATIRLGAGYKAPSKVIATVKTIHANPRLASCDITEPEARGSVAAAYQRANEPPGTFWFDIEGDLTGVVPDEERVRAAAKRAIANLKAQAVRGRPIAQDAKYLAVRLREIFLRFNDSVTRKMVLSSLGGGKYIQKEAGLFFTFVKEVLAPLNRYLASLASNGDTTPALSAEYMTRLVVRAVSTTGRSGGSPIFVHNFHRAIRGQAIIKRSNKESAICLEITTPSTF